jgi:hypothetical protein
MISVSAIVVDDFKDLFVRDFKYAIASGETVSLYDCQKDYVMDSDITRAFNEATINFNESLFSDDTQLKIMFLYLAAHYLVNDLNTATQGMGGSSSFAVSSRSIGGVSESYSIPQWMLNDPILGAYATTRYGQKYISLLKPLLIGNMVVEEGATTPW